MSSNHASVIQVAECPLLYFITLAPSRRIMSGNLLGLGRLQPATFILPSLTTLCVHGEGSGFGQAGNSLTNTLRTTPLVRVTVKFPANVVLCRSLRSLVMVNLTVSLTVNLISPHTSEVAHSPRLEHGRNKSSSESASYSPQSMMFSTQIEALPVISQRQTCLQMKIFSM